MDVSWRSQDNRAWYATVGSARGTVKYHLVVEHVPDLETWDWVVWRKGAPADAARQGSARTSADGKAQAEAVVCAWEKAADWRDDGED